MSRRFQEMVKNVWTARILGLVTLTLFVGGSALADSTYLLQVKGNNLKAVAQAHGLTLKRQLFSSSGLSVGVVSAPSAAAINDATRDTNVAKIELDRALPSRNRMMASLSQATSSMQAWLLSMQNATQKRNSFLNQPALDIVNAPSGNQGTGVTVAVIDTAVDPNHPLLAGKLVAGADCVTTASSNACQAGTTSIFADPTLDQSTVIILDQSTVIILDQSTVIILDQSTVIILDSKSAQQINGASMPADLGHGTMVSSLILGAAPNAKVMPIRAFNADGSANLSDIVAAIYYAVDHGAKVINMSFDVSTSSDVLSNAIDYANAHGVVCVASAANTGSNTAVYPAAYNGKVIGVGSVDSLTGYFRSSFSGYGQPNVDVYAPGEAMIAAFPGNHYAVVSGTSFSTALASGAAATLLSGKSTSISAYQSAITSTGPTVLFPYDGTKRLDLKAALKGLK